MNEAELLSIVETEERKALGWGDGELSFEREQSLKYYKGELYGDEVEGRSQIVTTEVQDTVEWILPSLLKIFTASDKAVEFEPEGPEDEQAAKQATDTCNYVFYRQNSGFVNLYSLFKDALIQKNGYLKVWYEKSEKVTTEQYQALNDAELDMLVQNPAVEIVQHTAYPAPMSNFGMMQPMMLHDVVIKVKAEDGKVTICPVPPEEILVSASHRSVDPQGAPFFAHRQKKTISELKDMGFDVEELQSASDDNHLEASQEFQTRHDLSEETTYRDTDHLDPSMRGVWVTEAYLTVDFDGDGIAELRKVTKAGKTVLENEETEIIPFACLTPIINTHRHSGVSVADLVMDLQRIKSTLTRQVLDNIYLTNAPRMAVIDGQANLDDLLTVRPGGLVRMKSPNAVTPLQIPFMAQHGLAAMEYFDTVRAKRTGVTEQFAGVDADALNQTARGATIMQSNAMQRIELIARIFAETGVKNLFKLILHCLVKYNNKPMTIRLLNKFVTVDPRNWKTSMDMTVNVGLGTGDKDQQLGHLQAIAMAQAEAVKMGGLGHIVTMKNVYQTQAKIVENAGFKNVEDFWTDPDGQDHQPPPPKPDPEMIKAQAQMQLEDKKMQGQIQMKQADLQGQLLLKQADAQIQAQQSKQIEQMKMAYQLQCDRIKADAELRANAQQLEFEKWKAKVEASTKIMIARLQSKTTVKTSAMSINAAREQEGLTDVDEATGEEKPTSALSGLVDAVNMNFERLLQTQAETSGRMVEAISQSMSKPRTLLRHPETGKVMGVQ